MDKLDAVRFYISLVERRGDNQDNDEKVQKILSELKSQAVAENDQGKAKEIWCCEQILLIQRTYLSAFDQMKKGSFYEAWCLLERVEIELHFLERHYTYDGYDCKLWFIDKHTRQFQSLYPYKLFISPAFIKKEITCSICKRIISIRNSCGHTAGEIYDGEMCSRIVTDAELIEFSLTPEPHQKYSVAFMVDSETNEKVDHYNYTLVEYVIRGLQNPFDGWDITWTKYRHPHSRYADVKPSDECPCESGRKYQSCCLSKEGVLRPHAQITFWVPPPGNLPSVVYSEN